jgi:ankyrin repeat protein
MDRQRRILEKSVEGIEGTDTWMNLMWQQATGDPGPCRKTADKDPVQQEPLHTQDLLQLAKTGTPEQIEAALRKGAKVLVKDCACRTPLMHATGYDANPKVALALLKAGANVRVKSLEGKTAYDYAAENQKLKGTDVCRELFNAAL